jgi:hypothetical protein
MGDAVVVDVVEVVVVIGSVAQLANPRVTRTRTKNEIDLSFSMAGT